MDVVEDPGVEHELAGPGDAGRLELDGPVPEDGGRIVVVENVRSGWDRPPANTWTSPPRRRWKVRNLKSRSQPAERGRGGQQLGVASEQERLAFVGPVDGLVRPSPT
jgi:hypothetical protein